LQLTPAEAMETSNLDRERNLLTCETGNQALSDESLLTLSEAKEVAQC
jgi:hypothetical protein